MNKVILTGNLVRDPELKQTTNGKSVLSNTLAVNREIKGEDGTYPTDFIDFTAWGQQAEYLARYGRKGDRVELCGRWQQRHYKDQNGYDRRVDECQVENLSVFSRQQPSAPSEPQQPKEAEQIAAPIKPNFADIIDGDLPF